MFNSSRLGHGRESGHKELALNQLHKVTVDLQDQNKHHQGRKGLAREGNSVRLKEKTLKKILRHVSNCA